MITDGDQTYQRSQRQYVARGTIGLVWKYENGPNKWAKRLIRVEVKTSAPDSGTARAIIEGKIGDKTYFIGHIFLPKASSWSKIVSTNVNEPNSPPLAAYDEILLLMNPSTYSGWWVQSEGYSVEIEYSIRGKLFQFEYEYVYLQLEDKREEKN